MSEINHLIDRLGSCDCMTKSPDVQQHGKLCKYRVLVERDELKAEVEDIQRIVGFDNEEPLVHFIEAIVANHARLRAENAELKNWKESMMEIEKSWDEQAVAKLLGIPLGAPIRPAIESAIRKLKEGQFAAALREEKAELANLLRRLRRATDAAYYGVPLCITIDAALAKYAPTQETQD